MREEKKMKKKMTKKMKNDDDDKNREDRPPAIEQKIAQGLWASMKVLWLETHS